jgi:hypothetical protein
MLMTTRRRAMTACPKICYNPTDSQTGKPDYFVFLTLSNGRFIPPTEIKGGNYYAGGRWHALTQSRQINNSPPPTIAGLIPGAKRFSLQRSPSIKR